MSFRPHSFMATLTVVLLCMTLLPLSIVVISQVAAAQSSPGKRTVSAASLNRSRQRQRSRSLHSILVMVNDDPITRFDVRLRAGFLSLQSNINKNAQAGFKRLLRSKRTQARFKALQREVITANRGKSREQIIKIFRARQKRYAMSLQQRAVANARAQVIPKMRRKALTELIEEHLKMQGAKKVNVRISNDTVNDIIKKIATQNKKTVKQFSAGLRKMGTNVSTMKARMKANFAWRQTVNRRFGSLVSINDAQIDTQMASAAIAAGGGDIELRLQKITLALPAGNDQMAMAKQFAQAERMTKRYKNCKTMKQLVKGVAGARFTALGMKNPKSIAEPTRTMLLSAANGQLTPPTLTGAGIEFYAVCGRRAAKGSDEQRAAAKGDLRQKEFQALAKRHMRDLRAEARICRRQAVKYAMNIRPCS